MRLDTTSVTEGVCSMLCRLLTGRPGRAYGGQKIIDVVCQIREHKSMEKAVGREVWVGSGTRTVWR
jgi:hypothetical protein